MIDMLISLYDTIVDDITILTTTLTTTISYIDSINFEDNGVTDFLGYARFLFGDVNYIALCTFFIAGLGLTMWVVVLKIIGLIKNLLPW